MSRDGRDEPRFGPETRSEFLRGQVRQWMEEVGAGGKTADLFELEMWLLSFERFFRIKNQHTRNILGSGLGLSIVKKIAALYGGDVTVQSEAGVGSTFTVLLNRTTAGAAGSSPHIPEGEKR